jgi:chondroitin AC lyase
LKIKGTKTGKMAVSDPSRKLNTTTVTIPGIYGRKGVDFDANPDNNLKTTTFKVKLPQGVYAGKSVVIEL